MLYQKFCGNRAARYGNRMERFAREKYLLHQQQNGNPGLKVFATGLVISPENPWLAASPDNRVHDPKATPKSDLAEYKKPFSARQMTLSEACAKSTFCLQKIENEVSVTYKLKDHHFQMQCQMYCDDKEWCDFVVSCMLNEFSETGSGGESNLLS